MKTKSRVECAMELLGMICGYPGSDDSKSLNQYLSMVKFEQFTGTELLQMAEYFEKQLVKKDPDSKKYSRIFKFIQNELGVCRFSELINKQTNPILN